MTPEARIILALRAADDYLKDGAPVEGAIHWAAAGLGVDALELKEAWSRKRDAVEAARHALAMERAEIRERRQDERRRRYLLEDLEASGLGSTKRQPPSQTDV
jgi:hypothetical protein